MGIDYDAKRIAYAILDKEGRLKDVGEFGYINYYLLSIKLKQVLQTYPLKLIGVEQCYVGLNSNTIIKLAKVLGAIITVCGQGGYHPIEVNPRGARALLGIKDKAGVLVKMEELYPDLEFSPHEADAYVIAWYLFANNKDAIKTPLED